MLLWTFVFEDGKVLTIEASTRKEAIEIIHDKWFKDICFMQNFKAYRNTGWSIKR